MAKEYISLTHNFKVNGQFVATVPALLRRAGWAMLEGKNITITCERFSDGGGVDSTIIGNWVARTMTSDQLVNVCLGLASGRYHEGLLAD
jgi:hypothetical protein